MPRSSLPTLLGMTLVLPSAALAFGLGDIHVKSALHEPLDNLESKSAAPAASPAATLEEAARIAEPERVAAVSADESLRRTYTVAPRDTLERIARLAGARSASERRRMMIAIFRANQDAFQNNLNRLRSGVTLRLPSQAELSAVSADEAEREYASRMRTGGASDHCGAAPITVAAQ